MSKITTDDYRATFDSPVGAAVLMHLRQMFCQGASADNEKELGIDRVLNTYKRLGAQELIAYIDQCVGYAKMGLNMNGKPNE